jgi:DNA-binding beta-propeller fold protein YncE
MQRFQLAFRMFSTLAHFGWILALSLGAAQATDYLGPGGVVAAKDGNRLYVAAEDAARILVLEVPSSRVTDSLSLPGKPTGLVLSPDGSKLYVTCGGPRSLVVVIETASGRTVATIPAGHTAMGPSLTPDGKTLCVVNRFEGDVAIIDLERAAQVARVPVTREPVASAVTPDGRSLVVANHLPADQADSFYVTAIVTIVDLATHGTTEVRLPNGSTGLGGLCLSPDGRHAYVTHVLGNYELVPAQVVGGWTNTNVLSVIDTVNKKLLDTVLLDDAYLGAANPWGVASTVDGKWLSIVHAGTDELSVIDAPALLGKLYGGQYTSPPASGIPHSRSILTGLRRRIKLPGKGPRGLAVVGSTAYVAAYFSDTLCVVDLEPDSSDPLATIALGPAPQLSVRRQGEMLFNDATICYQHWQSCASCHPDARTDGFNWDLTNDGVGNPKNTKSMLLAHRTPPAMSGGVRPSAEAAVRSGLSHILFADQPEADAAAIDEYLESLEPVPSPYLVDGRLSPAARRGKELFESDEVGCAQCHPSPLYTDLLQHDVGTQGPYDHRATFDTPTLIESWRTAPYLHDGRYRTLQELIAEGRHGATRGNVDGLDQQQIDDLAEFVLSL